jgi:PEP-CTERM motif
MKNAFVRGTHFFTGVSAIAFALFAVATPSWAQLSISDQFNFTDTYGVNPVGNGAPIGSTGFYVGGTYDSVGANSVTPSADTTVTATQGGFTYNIPFIGGPGTANPDEFYRDLPLDPSLTGAWTLTATNPNQPSSAVVETPTLNVLDTPPLATGVTLSGSGLGPTVTWSVPANSSATTQTVYVFETGFHEAIYKGPDLAAGTSSFVLPTGVLTAGDSYSIGVQEDIRTSGTTGSLESRSRSFTAYFTATSGTISTSIVLPTVSSTVSHFGGPIYDFDTPVSEGVPISIDPQSAIGFIYQIGSGDPDFASVELPNVGNPGPYDLYLWNGSKFVFDQTLAADTTLMFAPGGVGAFEILGIASSVGLNPNSATDFVTKLTFTGSGVFNGTMTPVIVVPEPSTWAMLVIGFLGLGYAGYRRPRLCPAPL